MKLTGGLKNFNDDVWVHGNMHCTTLTVDDPVELLGNIETATTLKIARTISLSGDVSGSISFDGSANVDIVSTVANDSHTHDSMYYTETELNAGQLNNQYYTETELDAGQLDNRYFTETEINNTFLPLTGGTISSDLTVSGNLTVSGTTTTIDTTELTIEDNLITVNSNQIGTPSTLLESGIEVERGDELNYHFLFRESDDTFVIGEVGSEQAVATREDSPASFGVTYWDTTAISLIALTNGTAGQVLTANTSAAPSWADVPAGVSVVLSGSSTVGALKYNGIVAAEGALHGGAAAPTGVAALTYNGYLYATKIFNAVYNDIAEFMSFSHQSIPGDVLVSINGKVRPSYKRGMKTVVGIHSDTFGYGLGSENQDIKTPVGLTGRVNVWIAEPCKEGDLLISAKAGYASVKRWYDFRKGIIIGKALKTKKNSAPERIEMLIMMA